MEKRQILQSINQFQSINHKSSGSGSGFESFCFEFSFGVIES